jgi:hypothetical protein
MMFQFGTNSYFFGCRIQPFSASLDPYVLKSRECCLPVLSRYLLATHGLFERSLYGYALETSYIAVDADFITDVNAAFERKALRGTLKYFYHAFYATIPELLLV